MKAIRAKVIISGVVLLIAIISIAIFFLNRFSAEVLPPVNLHIDPLSETDTLPGGCPTIEFCNLVKKQDGTQGGTVVKLPSIIRTLTPGSTLEFGDGTYYLGNVLIFGEANSMPIGDKNNPITIKAENYHGATLFFKDIAGAANPMSGGTKVRLESNGIIFENFKLTQTAPSSDTDRQGQDRFIRAGTRTPWPLDRAEWVSNITMRNNYVFGQPGLDSAYEECYKADHAADIFITNNYCYGTVNDGIDLVAVDRATIANNTIVNTGRVGILAKGGSRSIQIHDNYISARNKNMTDNGRSAAAIFLGGGSSWDEMVIPDQDWDPAVITLDNGLYEITDSAAWNNVILAENGHFIKQGLAMMGAQNSGFFNNLIKNNASLDTTAFYIGTGGIRNANYPPAKNWPDDKPLPITKNCKFRNNIVYGSDKAKNPLADNGGNWDTDSNSSIWNTFSNVDETLPPDYVRESHSLYEDPLLTDVDFHLTTDSPARSAATTISFWGYPFLGKAREHFTTDKDYAGNTRIAVPVDGIDRWDMGVYEEKIPYTGSNMIVHQSADKTSIRTGDEITYRIVHQRVPATDTTNAIITDRFDARLEPIEAFSSDTNLLPRINGQTVTWTIPTIPAYTPPTEFFIKCLVR